MLLSLITNEYYHSIHLPEEVEGRYLLTAPGKDEPLFVVTGRSGSWKLEETPLGRLSKDDDCALSNGKFIKVRIGKDLTSAYLYAETAGNPYGKYARCPVPDDCEFSVGTDLFNDFVCFGDLISPNHTKLICRDRKWYVEDRKGSIGTFVNGKRAEGLQPLVYGDVVSVMNQKFIPLAGLLAFNAQSIDLAKLKNKFHSVKLPEIPFDHPFAETTEQEYFHRQPRFTQGIRFENIQVSGSSIAQNEEDLSPLLTYGPAITSGVTMLLGGLNPMMGVGMMASSILFPSLSKNQRKKLKAAADEKRIEEYDRYLKELEAKLSDLQKQQTAILHDQMPEPIKEAAALIADQSMLWSRRPEHPDFLLLRLGLGDLPMKVNLTFPEERFDASEDEMFELLQNFKKKPHILKNIPIALELDKFFSVGIAGSGSEEVAKSLLGQLSMHDGYDDLQFCLLGPLKNGLEELRWLPHTWQDENSVHLTAENKAEVTALLPALDRVLSAHKKTGDLNSSVRSTLIVLITDPELAHTGMLTRLLFDRDYERVHVITLAERSIQLPSRTDAMIETDGNRGVVVWQDQESRRSQVFERDRPIQPALNELIPIMANTKLDLWSESTSLPTMVPFLDMFGAEDVEHLNLLRRWKNADPIRTLKTPIGISEDGDFCMLDVHEKADGPHGLIAGTTGSGKSEMIMSYILSMAINYSPQDVAFALIDYKGGGMANAFRDLPHTAGVITNLDGNALKRTLTSIESENRRRQRIFAETQSRLGMSKMEIRDYQKLFREGKVSEPIPHLLIICDEFAELKSQAPEFMQDLISAARIGRSLGVHLILATQQPAGVVDEQITSNTNFRICLRMASAQDSSSILKVPDAAALTTTGSLYKKVESMSVMVKAQSGYAGAEYAPEKKKIPLSGVEVLDHDGEVIRFVEIPRVQTATGQTQAVAITKYIIEVARREHLQTRKLWLPELEEDIPLASLQEKYPEDGTAELPTALLGELDDPAGQCRRPVYMTFGQSRNTMLYGAVGSGKTMALTTVIMQLVRNYTPDQVRLYLLDYGDDGLGVFGAAPHVGDVLFSDDDEKLVRFLSFMEQEISDRKKLLGGSLMSTPLSQRLKTAGLSQMVVVLHQLSSIQAKLEEKIDRLIQIMKEGSRWGITFLATQETTSGIRFQLQERFAVSYMLQMDHDDDYHTILGRTGGLKPDVVKGRGLVKEEDKIYLFQTASYGGDPESVCRSLSANWAGRRPVPIRIMPEHVLPEALVSAVSKETPLKLPIGMDLVSIEPAYYPFYSRNVHLVLGNEPDIESFMDGLSMLAQEAGLNTLWLRSEDGNQPVDALFDECRKIKQMTEEEKAEIAPRLILIPSVSQMLSELNEDGKASLRTILKLAKARKEWKFTILAGDAPQKLSSLKYDAEEKDWMSVALKTDEGIFIGGGFSTQSFLQVSGNPQMLYQNINTPMGYMILNGKAKRLKLLEGKEPEIWM